MYILSNIKTIIQEINDFNFFEIAFLSKFENQNPRNDENFFEISILSKYENRNPRNNEFL
jgi:hypothetical protein